MDAADIARRIASTPAMRATWTVWASRGFTAQMHIDAAEAAEYEGLGLLVVTTITRVDGYATEQATCAVTELGRTVAAAL